MAPGGGAQQAPGPGTGGQQVLMTGSGPQVALGPGSGAHPVMNPGSGPQATLGPGSGAHPVMNPGSGPQATLGPGSGAHPVMNPGSGPQQTLERTPVRGYPPVLSGPPGREQPGPPPQDASGAWHMPGTSFAGEDGGDADGDWYAGEDDGGEYPPGEPDDPASAAPARRRRGDRTPRTGRTRHRFFRAGLLAAAAVAVVAAGGFAGYKYLYEPRVNAPVSPSLRLPTNAPGSSGFDQALGKWQHIGTRAEDPQPLTLQQLYPPQFQLDGSSYLRTAASTTTNCSLAVFGSKLQTTLQSGHCTQVLRASYISGSMMGTIGVVNLISSTAAQRAGQVTGPQEIIAPLSSSKGATRKLGSGTGVVQAEIKGHYLILMWAEFTSLKSPSTPAQKQQLEQFASSLVTGGANIDLSARMLTGKT
jgi:hypothetical protein